MEANIEFYIRHSGYVKKFPMKYAADLFLHVRVYSDHLSCNINFGKNGTIESCRRPQ